jgi:hypothetical protein
MVTGFPPFHSENRMQMFEAIVYKNPDLSKVTIPPPSSPPSYRIY